MQDEIKLLMHRKQQMTGELDNSLREEHKSNRMQENYQQMMKEKV